MIGKNRSNSQPGIQSTTRTTAQTDQSAHRTTKNTPGYDVSQYQRYEPPERAESGQYLSQRGSRTLRGLG